MARTPESWRNLARALIGKADLSDKVAAKCVEEEAAGRNTSVFHALSLVTGERCLCTPCCKARGETPALRGAFSGIVLVS